MGDVSGPRSMLGLGISVVAAIWLIAIALRQEEVSNKFWQVGFVVAGWFLLMTIDIYVGR